MNLKIQYDKERSNNLRIENYETIRKTKIINIIGSKVR